MLAAKGRTSQLSRKHDKSLDDQSSANINMEYIFKLFYYCGRQAYKYPILRPHPLHSDSGRTGIQYKLQCSWILAGCYGYRHSPKHGFKACKRRKDHQIIQLSYSCATKLNYLNNVHELSSNAYFQYFHQHRTSFER